MMNKDSMDTRFRIERVAERLTSLDAEKAALLAEMEALQGEMAREERRRAAVPASRFTPEEKIQIFKSLFRGREDVFPKRWDNAKTGKSGYAPACRNEWVKGVCGKPLVKCGECMNQAFIPANVEIMRRHLAGEHTIGVYPISYAEGRNLLVSGGGFR